MDIASSIDVKCSLVGLVSNAIAHAGAKHHLVAAHVVKHDVFKDGHEGLLVYQVEEDLFVRCHLNTNVTFDVVNETSYFQHCVLFPISFAFVVLLDHEEQDVGGASCYESSVVH